FAVVRDALQRDLQEALRRDAAQVAAAYDGAGDAGTATATRPGPTGRVRIQLYGPDGRLFAASDPAFEAPSAAVPDEVVRGAPADWRGDRDGVALQAASAPFQLGTVVVLAETGFVAATTAAVGRALAVASLLLLVVAGLVGAVAARAATAPVRRLADRASRLGPEDLAPLAMPSAPDEVGRLAQVLDELLVRLRDARDGQRRFLAETSHELRTPLTSLRGFLRRARRRAGPEVQADLDHADRIAAGMSRLVEDLLELSRGQLTASGSTLQGELHLIDVGPDVIRPVVGEFDGVVAEGEGETLTLGDPERLRQVIRNLVANAVRAAGPDGEVRVRHGADHGEAWIEVRDDGPGIDPAVRDRLFEPFRPGPGGGAGLGLAIAHGIVTAHRGRITVRSDPGDTRIEARLPSVEVGEEAER
ncbi:MAG: HAMP domain-containing sensor histidine kinase, partial [Trueperaceae bacterium]